MSRDWVFWFTFVRASAATTSFDGGGVAVRRRHARKGCHLVKARASDYYFRILGQASMTAKQWRQRCVFTLLSAFVTWHTFAMVVAPVSQKSAAAQLARRILDPYLTLFRLDNAWDFYAPIVGTGQELRYAVVDADGKRSTFVATAGLKSWHPHFWWYRAWHNALIESPDIYGDYFATLQCRNHAAMHPASVDLVKIEQKEFSRQDYLDGKDPAAAEFLTETALRSVKCPQS
jgi:hypothetical protein